MLKIQKPQTYKYLGLALVNFFLSLVQTAFLFELLGSHINPPLIFLVSFAIYLSFGKEAGLFSAFTGGLFLDLVLFNTWGMSSLTLLVFIFVAHLTKKYVTSSFLVQILIMLLFSSILHGVSDLSLGFFIVSFLVFSFFYWICISLTTRTGERGFRVHYLR